MGRANHDNAGKQRGGIVKRGQCWYVRIIHNGKEVKRSAGRSKQAAQELLGKLRADLDREAAGLAPKPKGTVLLCDFVPQYLAWARVHKRSVARDEWCLPQLQKVFGHLRLTEITKARVGTFIRDRSAEAAPATVNRQVALLRKVLSLAVEYGEIENNPLRGIKLL
ncbi:MAG: hypothetical protein FJ109_16800, partial [Deltaproteobacteria bacterium]|nr:hypothetical protein [Deltaproteobacteria bacterium]